MDYIHKSLLARLAIVLVTTYTANDVQLYVFYTPDWLPYISYYTSDLRMCFTMCDAWFFRTV